MEVYGEDRKPVFTITCLPITTSRNPRFNGARYYTGWQEIVDYRNNVIYNWGSNSAYGGEPNEIDANKASINMVANYYKPGPATRKDQISYRIVAPDDDTTINSYSNWYIDSNFVVGNTNATNDNWTYGVQGITTAIKNQIKSLTPFAFDITTRHTAEEAYTAVLQQAGSLLPRRDTIDHRIISEVENGTATYGGAAYGAGKGIIDSQDDVGGFPQLFSAPAPADRDHDGMPDTWETENGLNPAIAADRNGDADADGYTNLEEYLNGIAGFRDFIRPPSELSAELSDVRAITLIMDVIMPPMRRDSLWKGKISLPMPLLIPLPKNTTDYTDTALQFETTYTYRLRAFSATDTSVYSNRQVASTLSESGLPLQASLPDPADGETHVKTFFGAQLEKGHRINLHDIFFGTANPPPFVENITESSYIPVMMESGQTYFWRVDEQNAHGTTEGPVWSFTTRELLNRNWSDTGNLTRALRNTGQLGLR